MKENQQIEWKTSWRDEYLKWICGFANAEGATKRGFLPQWQFHRQVLNRLPVRQETWSY